MGALHKAPPPCSHRGGAVQVGPYKIYAGGTQYLTPNDLDGYDLIIPLTGGGPYKFGARYSLLAGVLVDYGGVPPEWMSFIEEVAGELKAGKRILTYCVGSHGRTGCFLASLIAHLETKEETVDPIRAVWNRHCIHAVETLAQAEAIYAIRGEQLPKHHVEEFTPQPQSNQQEK